VFSEHNARARPSRTTDDAEVVVIAMLTKDDRRKRMQLRYIALGKLRT